MLYADISSENIRKLMSSAHLSIRQVADKLTLPPSTLTDALKSKSGLSIDMLVSVAELFGVSVSDLCNADFNPPDYTSFSEQKLAHIRSYELLDAQGKEIVDFIVAKELERSRKSES